MLTPADWQDIKAFAWLVEAYHALQAFLCWVYS